MANTWTTKNPIPTGREGAIGFSCVVGGTPKAYIGFGNTSTGQPADLYEFNAGSWTLKWTGPPAGTSTSPSGREYAIAVSDGKYGYMGTGNFQNSNLKDLWKYDPVLNTWLPLPVPTNFIARHKAIAFYMNGKIYIGTGNIGGSSPASNDFWEFNTSTLWKQLTPLPVSGLIGSVGFAIGSVGYVGTGADKNSSGQKDFYAFDRNTPTGGTGTWTLLKKAEFPEVLSNGTGFTINNKAYVLGNNILSNTGTNFYEFNPKGSSGWKS